MLGHATSGRLQYWSQHKGKVNVRRKALPVTGREGPEGCETSSSQIFQTIGSQMAVRLSALRAGRPLTPRNIPGTHVC
jgi:hypothetical protein